MRDAKAAPSSRWTSYDGWDYNGMKERLERFMQSISKGAFLSHAKKVCDKSFNISKPFSAGQHWAAFELVADDGDLVIVRARLPRHPSVSSSGTMEDEMYAMACEAATMKFLSARNFGLPFPRLYDYAAPGSAQAQEAGCAYMIIQGFYGNTLQDVEFDICQLPVTQQEHIVSQWTNFQAELAAVTFPQIGSICQVSDSGEVSLGKISSAPFEGLPHPGPFSDSRSYFHAVAKGRLSSVGQGSHPGEANVSALDDEGWCSLGIKVFLDILQNTNLFTEVGSAGPFHFNHMDLGTQNILVDDNFNFLAIIDWEFAQSAPWEVNHYPMPFPLISSPAKDEAILSDPDHIAYRNVSKQVAARKLYRQGFRAAEHRLQLAGRGLHKSIAEVLESPAAIIFGCFEKLGVFSGQAEALTNEMIRLAFGHTGPALEQYLSKVSSTSETTDR